MLPVSQSLQVRTQLILILGKLKGDGEEGGGEGGVEGDRRGGERRIGGE